MIRGLLLALALALAPCVASAQLLLVGVGPGARASASLPVPTFNWAAQANGSVATTSLATTKGANTITVGQLLVAGIQLPDNSGIDHVVQCPTGGWTAFSWSPSYDGNTNWAWCWKIAAGGDTGGAFSFTWTTVVTQIPQATLLSFSGHNATTPIDVTGNASSQVAPTVTTTGANRLLVSCSGMPGSSVTVSSQPGTMTNLFTGGAGANARTQCASETFASAGATGTRTWVWSANNGAQSMNFAIAP